ncbi:MAG: methylenetetrahydrofolate reductase, partial [Anaerolineae bacterium]|nr:methylenetetrahydrofolate reductase [Anaerolineae bacterium]
GDLLGAHAMGLRNLFVCMGDPTKIGDYPDAMDNYDISPSALIQVIKQRLNRGIDQAGNAIGLPTSFTIGCALNMGAKNSDKEIDLLIRKIDNGADFALSQPVFEPERAQQFLHRYEEIRGEPLHLPILMGVMPLYSLRHAQFLHNEIPGIDIPPAILKRIEDAGENADREGVYIASELIQQMRAAIHGTYIIPPFGKYDLAAQVIDAMGVSG